MKRMVYIVIFGVLVTIIGCSPSMQLKPSTFAWPIETVLEVDQDGGVSDTRYAISINVKQLFLTETGDSTNIQGQQVRIIRDVLGYYYLTATGFKNVYIFASGKGTLDLVKTVLISKAGMIDPAFNQRAPYIEVLDGGNSYKLTSEGYMGE